MFLFSLKLKKYNFNIYKFHKSDISTIKLITIILLLNKNNIIIVSYLYFA